MTTPERLRRMKPAFAERHYLTLDDYATLAAARSSPEQLLGGAMPITIDEVQRCPELLVAFKRERRPAPRPGSLPAQRLGELGLAGSSERELGGARVVPATRAVLTTRTARCDTATSVLGRAHGRHWRDPRSRRAGVRRRCAARIETSFVVDRLTPFLRNRASRVSRQRSTSRTRAWRRSSVR